MYHPKRVTWKNAINLPSLHWECSVEKRLAQLTVIWPREEAQQERRGERPLDGMNSQRKSGDQKVEAHIEW